MTPAHGISYWIFIAGWANPAQSPIATGLDSPFPTKIDWSPGDGGSRISNTLEGCGFVRFVLFRGLQQLVYGNKLQIDVNSSGFSLYDRLKCLPYNFWCIARSGQRFVTKQTSPPDPGGFYAGLICSHPSCNEGSAIEVGTSHPVIRSGTGPKAERHTPLFQSSDHTHLPAARLYRLTRGDESESRLFTASRT